MTTTTEQARRRRAENLFEHSAFWLAELLNQVRVLEAIDRAVGGGEFSPAVMSRACESFLLAANRIKAKALKQQLLFRDTQDRDLIFNDPDLSLEGDEADEGGGQRAYRVNSPIADINALAGDYLVYRPEHPTRPLVLHRTLTPEAVCLEGEDERLELIGDSIPVEREREEEQEE
jgi:hypothetical protein